MRWEELRSSYDHVARKYEDRFLSELDGKPRDRDLLAAFAATVEDPVVEIGSGPGQIGRYVRAQGRRVMGLDVSVEMVRLAATRLDGALAADMRALPLADARVGAIVAFYSLIHLRRAEVGATLGELHRVLRPGGRTLLSAHEGEGEVAFDEFLDEPVPFVATLFTIDELVEASEAAAFTVRQAERRGPYPTESPTDRLYLEIEKPPTG
jgi:ubiquinone/menaquinone biosynthesis C-methylase UbiE